MPLLEIYVVDFMSPTEAFSRRYRKDLPSVLCVKEMGTGGRCREWAQQPHGAENTSKMLGNGIVILKTEEEWRSSMACEYTLISLQ